jgi:aminoglycoside 6'-N-acetyltransferase
VSVVRLQGERVVLRRFTESDAPALLAYRNDPEVVRYDGPWSPLADLDTARAEVARFAGRDPRLPGWFQYAVDVGGLLVGDVGVGLAENLRQAELGIRLARLHQGRGYAAEALVLVVEHLLVERGLHKVSAECDVRNVRSAALLRRVGFRDEGLRRSHTWIRDEWTDDLLFGLLATDPRP